MLKRFNTNCNFLFLNKKIVIKANAADAINNPKYKGSSLANTSTLSSSVYKLNTNVRPPAIAATNNMYKLCIL